MRMWSLDGGGRREKWGQTDWGPTDNPEGNPSPPILPFLLLLPPSQQTRTFRHLCKIIIVMRGMMMMKMAPTPLPAEVRDKIGDCNFSERIVKLKCALSLIYSKPVG